MLSQVITSHGGTVDIVSHSLAAHLLYLIQSHSIEDLCIISHSLSPLIQRLLVLCPSLQIHTPQWIYDEIEGEKNSFQSIYCVPHQTIQLQFIRCCVHCEKERKGIERLIEQTGALVLEEGCKLDLLTHMVSDTRFETPLPILHYQWFIDCLQSGQVLNESSYLLSYPCSTNRSHAFKHIHCGYTQWTQQCLRYT